ncbi:MAG: VOC family protein [Cyanobacteria bacterium P01_A01_bin.114]
MHHASIRTADIHRAIAFYEQLGFSIIERFTAGITLACWMEGRGDIDGRIELIQVPEPHPAPDAFSDENYTGYYHLSFDLTQAVPSLPDWLTQLQQKFEQTAQADSNQALRGQPLKVLLAPQQQMIGNSIYEVAFIADADGLPLEFIRRLSE